MRMPYRIFPLISFFFILTFSAIAAESKDQTRHIEPSIFGDICIEDPVILDLLNAPVMKRLHNIDQSGTPRYFTHHVPAFTRYDHSVGVYALLKKAGVSLDEQIAGLLHDASHTVFSHTGDWVMGMGEKDNSYQDDIHSWFLKNMQVEDILHKHGHTLDKVLHKNNGHVALEQDLPDMCADRIEYNLHTGLIFGLLTTAEIKEIADDLHYENQKWFFTNPKLARDFANLSIYFTQYLWGSPYNQAINHWSGQMLKRAIDIQLVNRDTFHFGIDQQVLEKLQDSSDPEIQMYLEKCKNFQHHYKVVSNDDFDIQTKPKFRGIDPWVRVNGKLLRLTQIDKDYAREYKRVKLYVQKGIRIKFI